MILKKDFKKWVRDLNRHCPNEDIWTPNKHMKRCFPLLVIREIKVKTTMRFYLIPSKKTRIKDSVGDDVNESEPSDTNEECKIVQLVWKTVWQDLK